MKSWWEYLPGDPVDLGPLTVYPAEPQRTGLLNADGRPIYRGPAPLGFLTADVLRPPARPNTGCRIGKVKWK